MMRFLAYWNGDEKEENRSKEETVARCKAKKRPAKYAFRCRRRQGHNGKHRAQIYPGYSGRLTWGR